MMTTLRLYGTMGKRYGRVHRADLTTGSIGEAVRYLRANFKGVEQYLGSATKNGVGFAVFRGKENLTKDQLQEPNFGEDIRIAPVILGSKKGGIVNIIVGAVLIVAGAVVSYYGNPALGSKLAFAGYMQIIGGVIQMLTPRPKGLGAQDRPDSTPSYSFNGPVNTQAQGRCVPVLYGRMWVGSAVISAGMDVKDDIVAPIGSGQTPGGGVGGVGGFMGRFSNGVATA